MTRRILHIAAALFLLAGCESVEGSVTYEGETYEVVNCEQEEDGGVSFDTDSDLRVKMRSGIASIGTGECLEEGYVSYGCVGALGCAGTRWGCIRYDWSHYTDCSELDITEGDHSQGGKPVIDVEATIACQDFTGDIYVTSCNAG